MRRSRLDPRQVEVINDELAEVLRQKSPAQRVAMISEANQMARLLIEGGLRTRHPDWNSERIRAEVSRRMMRDAG